MGIASQYYICNRCHFRTTILSRFNDHLQLHIGNKQLPHFSYFDCFDRLKPLKCPSCDFSTESLVLLRYHLVQHHDQQQFALKAKLKTCKKCRFCTHSTYLWIRHCISGTCKDKKESKEKKKIVSMEKDSVMGRKMEVKEVHHNRKLYLCKQCEYCTRRSGLLQSHIIHKHTPLEEINWQHCNKCSMKLKTLVALKLHQKYVHMSAVDHLHCSECDYSTPSRQNLARHFNRKHELPEEINWAECHECGAKFNNKTNLKYHLKIHTNREKQYKCDQCHFKTHCKHILKGHIINRHLKDEEIQWYNCPHCDYKTKTKFLINKHINCMHLESQELVQCLHFKLLKCEHCCFSSKYKHSLKRHVLVKHNIGGEVYECKECDYKTISRRYLTQHIRRVHKSKPLECDQCIYKTEAPYLMKKHKKKHETI